MRTPGNWTIESPFGVRRKFAWIWLPQILTKKRPENSITLVFDLPRRVTHPRISASVEPRPGRWTYQVVIQSEVDLDGNVRQWLREAFGNGSAALPTLPLKSR